MHVLIKMYNIYNKTHGAWARSQHTTDVNPMKKAKYSLTLVTHWPSGTIHAARYGRESGQNPDTLLHGTGMDEGVRINESAIFKCTGLHVVPSFTHHQSDLSESDKSTTRVQLASGNAHASGLAVGVCVEGVA